MYQNASVLCIIIQLISRFRVYRESATLNVPSRAVVVFWDDAIAFVLGKLF